MESLLDLYGFASVVLRVALLVARTALMGMALFWVLIAAPLRRPELEAVSRRGVLGAGIATLLAFGLSMLLSLAALAATLDASPALLLGADFVRAALLAMAGTLAILGLAWGRGPLAGRRRAALGVAVAALLLTGAGGSHAVAQLEGTAMLYIATVLHQTGAALWLGGLPLLLWSLRRLGPEAAWTVGRRYSVLAASGVGLILLGTVGFWLGYIGDIEGVYGTAYGAMSATKLVFLVVLLALGGANFVLLHGWPLLVPRPATAGGNPSPAPDRRAEGLQRLRRFVESEIAVGVAVLCVAASLTSVPPAADLPEDRVTWAEITERFTPTWPRLTSPDHAGLAIPNLQAQLDRDWQAGQQRAATRPQAFTPGEGLLPPRNAADIAWSEYNHHWAGVVVLLVGLAALLDSTARVPLARHWPLLFLGLFAFLLIRSDPEAWPLGEIGLLDSMRDPEVVQHKLAAFLVLIFALAEWGVRLGRVGGRFRYVFPLAMLAGGGLLLAHTHAISNIKDAQLIELSHLPLAVAAVLGGCGRLVELRGPAALARHGRWLWPVCLIVIGALLLTYREA